MRVNPSRHGEGKSPHGEIALLLGVLHMEDRAHGSHLQERPDKVCLELEDLGSWTYVWVKTAVKLT